MPLPFPNIVLCFGGCGILLGLKFAFGPIIYEAFNLPFIWERHDFLVILRVSCEPNLSYDIQHKYQKICDVF
jgi:hypothetical protein